MTRHARHYPLARIRASAALLVAAGLAGCGSDPAYSSDLERFGNERGVENTIVDLPGGDRLSVGSPDRHDVVVQRYDAGAGGWTAPEVVHTESQLWTHYINVARAGATVSVSVDYWVEEVLDDDYSPHVSVGAVCAEQCTPGARPEEELHGSVQLADDGEYAVFGLGGSSFAAWDGDAEWRTEQLEDLGEESDVRLAGDGSFQAVTSQQEGEACVYSLHTTEPRGFDFTEQAATAPVEGRCGAGFNGTDEDDTRQAAVWVEAITGVIEFERADDGWRAVPLPRTYNTVPDTGGRTTLAPVHGRTEDRHIVLYSSDLKTIWAQTRYSPEKQWSRAVVAFTLPDGVACRAGRFEPWADRGELYALLDCFEGGRGPEGVPDTTLALITNHGHTWGGGLVDGAGRHAAFVLLGLVVSGTPGVVFPISSEENPEPEPEELALPFPSPGTDPIHLENDSVLRVAPRLTGGQCTATTWTATSLEAESWTAGVSFDVPLQGERCPELRLSATPAGVSVTADSVDGWKVGLRLRAGSWELEDPLGLTG